MDLVSLLPQAFMLVVSVFCIYVGSWRSTQGQQASETIDQKAALRFPIIGSCVLFGLYLLYKYIPKEYLNLLLSCYFCALGMFAVSQVLRPYLGHGVVAGLVGVALCAFHMYTNHWITNNILGAAFCITGIHMVPLSSTKVGALLLWLLFFYDIFWVFGTEVMVKVATSIDGPVKFLFPKDIFAEQYKFALLGLGDVVLPGFYISLMLRFDLKMSTSTPYFNTAMVCYVAGLVNTVSVMLFFNAAQPALLYLVPWVVGGTALKALSRSEFTPWWNYNEEVKKEAEEEASGSYVDEAYNLVAELFGFQKRTAQPKKTD